jgi:hypothetical protein
LCLLNCAVYTFNALHDVVWNKNEIISLKMISQI